MTAGKAQAAGSSLFFTPASGTYVIDQKFTIAVRAFVGGVNINASEGLLNFDTSKLEVESVSDSGSIFTMWTVRPTFSNPAGTISYAGGVQPPGFKGQSGKVISITFKAKAAGVAYVRFASGAILANDGKGSNILESMGSANFTIAPKDLAATSTANSAEFKTTDSDVKLANGVVAIEKLSLADTSDNYLKPGITSATHPDQNGWSGLSRAEFKWDLPQEVKDIALSFNKDFNSDPTESQGLVAGKVIENIGDGTWYLHVKFNDGKRWGATARYRVLVDSNRPTPFRVEIKQPDPNSFPRLFFKATDKTSGIDHYDVFVNSLEEREFEVPEDLTLSQLNVQLANLEYGEHMAMVRVVDKAGNETLATAQFRVEPIETPIIKNYAKEVRETDQFFISGTSLVNTKINIYIQDQNNQVVTRHVTSDISGNWFYLSSAGMEDGRYIVWVESENVNGLKSMPTEKISFLVSPPIFAIIGSVVVNYFTVIASLILFIILIVIGGYYLSNIIRRKLKKETIEVEVVLNEKLDQLQQVVDREVVRFSKLTKAPEVIKESRKMRASLSEHIDTARRKIIKEIKDVEDILR